MDATFDSTRGSDQFFFVTTAEAGDKTAPSTTHGPVLPVGPCISALLLERAKPRRKASIRGGATLTTGTHSFTHGRSSPIGLTPNSQQAVERASWLREKDEREQPALRYPRIVLPTFVPGGASSRSCRSEVLDDDDDDQKNCSRSGPLVPTVDTVGSEGTA
jgi:hypothetical protein